MRGYDFPSAKDCKSDFRLTAYMGESSVKCEKDTRSGTVRNFDTTGLFQPLDVAVWHRNFGAPLPIILLLTGLVRGW